MKLSEGAKMPGFEYLSPYREGTQSSERFLEGKKAFVVFLRYYGCTVCRVDMHAFTKNYSKFAETGTDIAVVLQSAPETVREEAPEGTFPFEVMCDPDQKVYEEFEIKPAKSKLALVGGGLGGLMKKRSEAKKLGYAHGKYEGNEQQLPRIVLVDGDGVIRYCHYAANIADMPSVDEMIRKAVEIG